MTLWPNEITGANAGGPWPSAIRTQWAARIAQFWRWALRTMNRKPSFLLCCAVSALCLGLPMPAFCQVRPVTMSLRDVSMTESMYTAVFVVTNNGAKPVYVVSCGWSLDPTNTPGHAFGAFGRCTVLPGSTSTLSATWGMWKPKPVSFRYAVFEEASTAVKAAVAAGRLSSELMGRATYTNLWEPNLKSAAYEIISPTVTVPAGPMRLPEPSSPPVRRVRVW
jgi:hypothetical protein